MYVCLCKGVTDGDIKNAVASGCRSLRELKRETGLATQCGKCSCHARDILHEELAHAMYAGRNSSKLTPRRRGLLHLI